METLKDSLFLYKDVLTKAFDVILKSLSKKQAALKDMIMRALCNSKKKIHKDF